MTNWGMTLSDTNPSLKGFWIIAAAVVIAGALVAGAIVITQEDDEGFFSSAAPMQLHNEVQNDAHESAREEIEATLRDAATVQESYFVDHETYAPTLADLQNQGLRHTDDVTITVMRATDFNFCIEVRHAREPGMTFSFDSDYGEVREEVCY